MSGPRGVPEQERPPYAGFVLGLDVGSSMIRAHVYDRAGRVRGSSAQKVTRGRASGGGSGVPGATGVGGRAARCDWAGVPGSLLGQG